jgi:L-fucose isomerase-like protein
MGGRAEILHGNPEYLRGRIEVAASEARARERLAKAKIGVIGFPSDWLISSAVDYAAARRRWAEKVAADFARGASKIVEPDSKALLAAARVYLALKKLAADKGLDAFTLKCFDILGSHRTTGCMALALLNQEGITAGCEGDERTVFTMHLARLLTGEVPFMANPSQIDADRNSAVFAHCTIAPCLTREYRVRSHFESGIGVGIQGIVPEGEVTVLKVGGPALDRYFVSAGRITSNPDDQRRCRTQLEIELAEDASYFLRAPLANHHVIVRGDHAAQFAAFMEAAGASRSS